MSITVVNIIDGIAACSQANRPPRRRRDGWWVDESLSSKKQLGDLNLFPS
jgi:hypothetical protein